VKKIVCLGMSVMAMTISARSPLIIGHRGASGYEPENTLRSFERAIAMGAQMIELDVHLAKSGEIVVIHDATIDRTTDGKGNVRDLSWKQLQKYHVGTSERLPLLSEVFEAVNQRATIIIELKDPAAALPVADLITGYVKHKKCSYENFIVASFDHYAVLRFHEYCPQVKTGVIFDGNPIGYADIARRAHANYAMMAYEWITKEFIADAHASGIQVFAYTVNTQAIAKKLRKLKIDGMVSNYPDILSR